MAKFRRKALVIEAVQYTGHNPDEISEFIGEDCSVETLEGGRLRVDYNTCSFWATRLDWFVGKPRPYILPPDAFKEVYEPVTSINEPSPC